MAPFRTALVWPLSAVPAMWMPAWAASGSGVACMLPFQAPTWLGPMVTPSIAT